MALEMIARDIGETPWLVVWLLTPTALVGALWLVRRRRRDTGARRTFVEATVLAVGALALQAGAWFAYYAVPLTNVGVAGFLPWFVLPTIVGLAAAVWAAAALFTTSGRASRTR